MCLLTHHGFIYFTIYTQKKHHISYFKYIAILLVNYIAIKLKKRKVFSICQALKQNVESFGLHPSSLPSFLSPSFPPSLPTFPHPSFLSFFFLAEGSPDAFTYVNLPYLHRYPKREDHQNDVWVLQIRLVIFFQGEPFSS